MQLTEIKKDTVRIVLFGDNTFENKEAIKDLGFVFGFEIKAQEGVSTEKFWNIVLSGKDVGAMYKKVVTTFKPAKIDMFGKIKTMKQN